jgi:hypothetical protein
MGRGTGLSYETRTRTSSKSGRQLDRLGLKADVQGEDAKERKASLVKIGRVVMLSEQVERLELPLAEQAGVLREVGVFERFCR